MTATGLACGSCGTELRAGDKFCHHCAAPVVTAATRAEYKQVTVLFADVVHSMDIAAAVGAERLREIMTELVNRAAAVVHRYGGTVEKFTGDGIMAVFGAPVALEDHAFRACMAALDMQQEAGQLAVDVERRDGVLLRLRIGLNSGQVIAGEIGSGPFGYTAIGEQVGMAQRMESVASPGGVTLSESTARLVEHTARLGELQMVQIKGAARPVPARQLLAVAEDHRPKQRREATLVGRRHEISMLEETLGRAIGGRGSVMAVKGPPGIGKSRITREVEAIAKRRGVEVISTFCESHSSGIPFHAVAGLFRGFFGVGGLAREQARAKTRATLPDSDPGDLVLLDDLLGIGDVELNEGDIDPDARRRRLTNLLGTALLARGPALYIIEDAHWIDAVSESMLTDFISVVPGTHALVLITYRTEYRGPLQAEDTMTLSLAPLDASHASALTAELLGSDPSVARLAAQVAERGAGNPFFTEEIVRDLAERNVLDGERGSYTSKGHAEVAVPATVQATIAARIDRLGAAAKHTLHAASVIGSRFDAELLSAVLGDVILGELVEAELIERLTMFAAGRVCVPASADAGGGIRVAAQIGSRATTSVHCGCDRTPRTGVGREERGVDRHPSGGCWRSTRGLRLAYAGWHLVDPPRHHRGSGELAARPRSGRSVAGRRSGPVGDADRPANVAVRNHLAGRRKLGRHRLRRIARVGDSRG